MIRPVAPLLEICDVKLQHHVLLGERHQRLGDHLVALDQIVELLFAREVGGQVVAAGFGRQRVGARVELAQARDQRRAGRGAQPDSRRVSLIRSLSALSSSPSLINASITPSNPLSGADVAGSVGLCVVTAATGSAPALPVPRSLAGALNSGTLR